jgi:very-short-patch-repair endonuclease
MSKIPKKLSVGEEMLALHLRAHEIDFVREYEFAPPRRYRADFYIMSLRLLIEVEGGNWSGGRHTRPGGYETDCAKYNLAAKLGYRLVRYTTRMVERGDAINDILEMMP